MVLFGFPIALAKILLYTCSPQTGEKFFELANFRHSPQIALAFTNQDGDSSIEAYQSRESHRKIGDSDCEQSKLDFLNRASRSLNSTCK